MNALKSKTVLFALALGLLGVAEQSSAVITQLVGQQNVGIVMMVIGVITAILRVVTTVPLSDK